MTEQDRIEYFKNEISRLSNQVVDLLAERDALNHKAGFESAINCCINLGMIDKGGEFESLLRQNYQCESNLEMDHIVKVNEMVTYWWREIGESDWQQCSKERYEHCQKSPEHDTKTTMISLSEIKAQAIREFVQHMDSDGPWMYRDDAVNYANQLRQQAKRGDL